MIICFNGKFVSEEMAKVSVFDHGFLYGDGIYETLRTYGGKIWQFPLHWLRLKHSAKLLGLYLPWKRDVILQWIEETIRRNAFPESRIRITVTRGVNGFDFLTCKNPTLVIHVQQLIPENEGIYHKGVKVIILKHQRFLPEAKTISLLPLILARREVAKKHAYEGLFVDDRGYVLEGTMTNVFMVKNSVIFTPSSNILLGTTRHLLLKIAAKAHVKLCEKFLKIKDFYTADEVFITNAPRGIIPVRKIDDKIIGSGKPGFVTLQLKVKFDEFVTALSSNSIVYGQKSGN